MRLRSRRYTLHVCVYIFTTSFAASFTTRMNARRAQQQQAEQHEVEVAQVDIYVHIFNFYC
jgi:hypothetical protein